MSAEIDGKLCGHLLQHFEEGRPQEDLCFALWRPSAARSRKTALLEQVILPNDKERDLHGGASFLPAYFERVMSLALEAEAGIAFMHSHPTPGWQHMSPPDVIAEERLAPRVYATTGLPLVGLTVGTDGAWSARFWPRIGPGQFQNKWCGTVRVVGSDFKVTFMNKIAHPPVFRDELSRTYSSWGKDKQALLARLRVGIIGAGSVGNLIGEALARMGIEDIILIDFDTVKRHNLDRMLHATVNDIGRLKVDVMADGLEAHATAGNFRVEALPFSVTEEKGYKAALDCDVLFSCVDRPWPRQALNVIAYAHLIPVIDGGINVGVTSSGKLRGADWRAHVASPDRPCLECLKQYDPANVSMERQGLLDDPTYVSGLPKEHFINRNENVFAFSMNAAGLQVLQFLTMAVQPGGISDTGQQTYHFVTGSMDHGELDQCKLGCPFPTFQGKGDHLEFQVTVKERKVDPKSSGGLGDEPRLS
ncbi:MAG: ThiF family adenylyltransferase [Alphaproteobacteria bacterium]|nr:ThiF family adenylyltransferase [Alphaproteobacteria bacterium]